MHKDDLLLWKNLRRQTRCCLFNALSINLRGSCLVKGDMLLIRQQLLPIKFHLLGFQPALLTSNPLTPGLLVGPTPISLPFTLLFTPVCLEYWHPFREMMLVKYQVHLSRSQEMGVDLVFVINSMFYAITRLQTMTKHSQSVFKRFVLQPSFMGTT